MHWPGVEPGSIAWKATMLTVTPPTLHTETRHGRIKLCSVLHNIDMTLRLPWGHGTVHL